LGLDLIKSLVLSLDVFNYKVDADLLCLDDLWTHSLQTGALAKKITTYLKLGEQLENEAFTAGVLHDIGHLIFAINLPDEYFDFVMKLKGCKDEGGIHKLEVECFGAGHESVGAYLLGIWGVPDSIIEAVALHSHPELSLETELSALPILHIADAIQYFGGDLDVFWAKAKVNREYIQRWDLEKKIPEFISIYRDMVKDESGVCSER